MIMRKIYILLTICCALIACKKNHVDFTYSPAQPRAGQTVYFSNHSSSGEEWEWTFGDGASVALKSPTHTYRNPGTYTITLKVDKKKKWMVSKSITIHDTVPTFTCSDSDLVVYKDYTFTAQVYNPYNYDVDYQWTLPLNTNYAVVKDTTMKNSTLHLYFTQEMDEAPVWLTVTMNGVTTEIKHTYIVSDQPTHSLLIRTPEQDYRQRIFGDRAEMYKPTTDTVLLNREQDTLQEYNGYLVRLSELAEDYPGIKGFHIASRKLYYREDGLWISNLDGSYRVQIDDADCLAMTLDTKDNRIYWATPTGVWYMPFIGSDNNKFITTPQQLNNLTGVSKLAVDYDPK